MNSDNLKKAYRWAWACAALVITIGTATTTDSALAAPSADATSEIAIVQFLAGSPLSDDEKTSLERYVKTLAQSNLKEAQLQAQNAALGLRTIAQNEPRKTGRVRELYRVYFAEQPESNPARGILARHDPVVALDRKRDLIITEHTLTVIGEAAGWAGHSLGVQLPANFRQTERAALAVDFTNADKYSAAAYARIESNFPIAKPAIDQMAPAAQRQQFTKYGTPTSPNASIGLARDAVSAVEFAAAKEIGIAAATGVGGNGSGGFDAGSHLMMQSMIQRQMRQTSADRPSSVCSGRRWFRLRLQSSSGDLPANPDTRRSLSLLGLEAR